MRSLIRYAAAAMLIVSATGFAEDNSAALQRSVRETLRTDPRTKDYIITADAYKDLVILHGLVYSRTMREDIEAVVKDVPGVSRVYSFFTVDDPEDISKAIARSESIQVTASSESDREGPFINTFAIDNYRVPKAATDELSREVSANLRLNPLINMYDFDVHSYNGAILLHGKVASSGAAREAEVIASRVPGVMKVFSYIQNPESEILREPEIEIVEVSPIRTVRTETRIVEPVIIREERVVVPPASSASKYVTAPR